MLIKKNFHHLIIAAAVIVNWFPIILVPFINDDFQILGYHFNPTLSSIFKPFNSPDISQVYWRPVGNMIHPIMLLLFGFNALPFRIASLIIYFFCCVVIYKASKKIGLDKSASLIVSILFALLPAHELQIAWIADQGESIVAIFLLLTFIFYSNAQSESSKARNTFFSLSLLFYVLSMLVKEVAFTGFLIPIIYLIVNGQWKKTFIVKRCFHSFVGLLFLFLLLLYRFIFIGGSPFSSNHFANTGFVKWIFNFFIYIPLSFFSAEMLDILPAIIRNPLYAFIITLLFSLSVFYLIKAGKELSSDRRKIFWGGIAWFIVFIIPALPNLMRWYSFTASIGLVISVSVLLYQLRITYNKKVIVLIALLPIVTVAYYNLNLMIRWQHSGEKLNNTLLHLRENKNLIQSDSAYIFGIPDKLNRIPMMKLGVNESVQWALQRKNITILAPIRSELINENPKIEFQSHDENKFSFTIIGGRFIKEWSTSRMIKEESSSFSYEGNEYSIQTKIDEDNVPISKVEITLKNYRGEDLLYFDGNKFVKINY